MKITINFDDTVLEKALQNHFDTALPIQEYINRALCYFDRMLKIEESGKDCGFGEKARFGSYNTVISPKRYLNGNYD